MKKLKKSAIICAIILSLSVSFFKPMSAFAGVSYKYTTVKINCNNYQEWLKNFQSSMRGLKVGKTLRAGSNWDTAYETKVIIGAQVLSTKTFKVKVPACVGPRPPMVTKKVKCPTKIRFKIHYHKLKNNFHAARFITGLFYGYFTCEQKCDCGLTSFMYVELPQPPNKVSGNTINMAPSISISSK